MAETEFLLPREMEVGGGSSLGNRATKRWLHVAVHVLSVSAVVLVLVWLVGNSSGFSWEHGNGNVFHWHPLMMTLAVVCGLESAVVFRTQGIVQVRKKRLHAVLHICSFVFMTVGLVAVFRFHNEHRPAPIKNLYSLHSWVGILTVTLFGVQAAVGLVTFLTSVCTGARKREFLPVHTSSGLVILVVCMSVTVMTGINERLIFIKACAPVVTSQCAAAHSLGLVVLALACVVFVLLR